MKYLVVGGVAGGATVAARLRRLDEKAQIIMFERGKYVSYANCGLPYYIGNVISERDKLFVQTVEGFVSRFRIDIRVEQEVLSVNPSAKTVTVRRLSTGETYEETYDKLVLSPGAEPLRPRIEGIDNERIMTLRNVPDTDAIKNFVTTRSVKRAVVVGGGFIGIEMAENLRELGIEVHLVEMANQVMAPLDFSMAAIVHNHLADNGVELHLSDGVSRFSSKENGVVVHLNSGVEILSDLVILSIGVRPETKLAREAGLELGTLGGIRVDEYMQTSDKDVYALGDAVEVKHYVTGKPAMIPLAGPANKQGRIVANNIVNGNHDRYPGSMGTSIAKIFSLTVAATGANAKLLKKEGIEYVSSYTHGSSHAGYYPEAVSLSIKILFSPVDGTLFGAQIVGFDGVDKRIEMLAGVIQKHGTIYDLMELEHAYAPPYSSAKDPVNMAGFVADNIISGRVKIISWRDVASLEKDTVKIDVRTAEEYRLGSIEGFRNIPVDELREHLSEFPKNAKIVVTCAVGLRGYLASRILEQNGFCNVYNLSGGYKTWCAATQPLRTCNMCKNGDDGSCSGNEVETETVNKADSARTLKVDACGLMCPGPVMKLKSNYETLKVGEQLLISATDQAFGRDVESWCRMAGAELVKLENSKGVVQALVRKTEKKKTVAEGLPVHSAENKTIVVFSDDLDKALASFVIANGAAATGKKVTMFFTFWGLNVIKKRKKPAVKKDFMGRMFGWMLPSHSGKLALSKMNMMGIGAKMMRGIMKSKNIDSLEYMIEQAAAAGVEMIACTMSMDVMGVKKEELLDNVTLSGVATYLERAEDANLNLFI